MTLEKAQLLTELIINELSKRRGFGHVIDEIDDETMQEVLEKITSILMENA